MSFLQIIWHLDSFFSIKTNFSKENKDDDNTRLCTWSQQSLFAFIHEILLQWRGPEDCILWHIDGIELSPADVESDLSWGSEPLPIYG